MGLETTSKFLRDQFVKKIDKNPAFSLRSFAKHLGCSPSYISELFSGKKRLSVQRAAQFARRLELSNADTEFLCALAEYESAKLPSHKSAILQRLDNLRPQTKLERHDVEKFRILSNWYHIPILEITELDDFTWSIEEVARRLKIHPAVANAAIERLNTLGLLKRGINGQYQKVKKDAVFESQERNAALQNFHEEMLEKAKRSLEDRGPKERLIGSETVAFDPDDLPQIESILREAARKVARVAQSGKNRREVYFLGMQFFQVTDRTSAT